MVLGYTLFPIFATLIRLGARFDYRLAPLRKESLLRKIVRERILERDNYECQICGSSDNLEVDHIIPLSEGGKHSEHNFQILCRHCNRTKKRKIETGLPLDDLLDYFNNSKEGDRWFDGDLAERKLRNAILKLPEKQKLVFTLKYYEDMSYEDMSRILNTSVGALKASYHHAVKKIEDFLTNS